VKKERETKHCDAGKNNNSNHDFPEARRRAGLGGMLGLINFSLRYIRGHGAARSLRRPLAPCGATKRARLGAGCSKSPEFSVDFCTDGSSFSFSFSVVRATYNVKLALVPIVPRGIAQNNRSMRELHHCVAVTTAYCTLLSTASLLLMIPARCQAFQYRSSGGRGPGLGRHSVAGPAQAFSGMRPTGSWRCTCYARGGSHLARFGYFPLGNHLFTDLLHYVERATL